VADRASFEGFYRENLSRVVKACTLILLDRSAAEDVAAEAFTRLWSRWGAIGDDDHAGGYVFKTAMRLCSKRVRQRARERAAPLRDAGTTDLSREVEDRRDIWFALDALPLRQRQAVVLRDWAGYETKDVASMLGMRDSTVRVHLARGRRSLRLALGERITDED
jgi:RNA polymerase sigma-70 factor (ECF subfamily)